jgi:hypothetical protein
MKLRLFAASSVLATLFAIPASAHGIDEHGPSSAAGKIVPTTCEQLADTQRYSNDTSNPDIRALKKRCDAKKAESDEKKL